MPSAAGVDACIAVNRLSEVDLRRELLLLPRLPTACVEPIVCGRPFADRAALVNRLKEAAAVPKHCIGPKLAARFDFTPSDAGAQPARTRNAEYGRELLSVAFLDLMAMQPDDDSDEVQRTRASEAPCAACKRARIR